MPDRNEQRGEHGGKAFGIAEHNGLAEVYGERAFADVTEHDDRPQQGAEGAERIGGAGVAAAVVADILIEYDFGEDDGKIEIPDKISHYGSEYISPYMHCLTASFFLVAFAHDHPDGRPIQAESLPDAVFQISSVGEVKQFRVVDKGDKGGRLYGGLGDVEQAQAAALVGRRLHARHGVCQHGVERARGNPHIVFLV